MIDGVGAGCDESMKVCKIPVAEAVEDLRMRVQLLHPAHVDGLHSRITQLLSKLQQVFFYVYRCIIFCRHFFGGDLLLLSFC